MGERLFHTLDPMTRSFRHEGRDYLLTDTVGFIRKLPHQLVEAFKATLEETTNADLILHVVDASAPEDELESMMERRRHRARGDRGGRDAAPRRPQQGRPDRSRGAAPAEASPPRRRSRVGAHRRGPRRAARAHPAHVRERADIGRAARPLPARERSSPSFTSSRATFSARTPPRASTCGRACRPRSRSGCARST